MKLLFTTLLALLFSLQTAHSQSNTWNIEVNGAFGVPVLQNTNAMNDLNSNNYSTNIQVDKRILGELSFGFNLGYTKYGDSFMLAGSDENSLPNIVTYGEISFDFDMLAFGPSLSYYFKSGRSGYIRTALSYNLMQRLNYNVEMQSQTLNEAEKQEKIKGVEDSRTLVNFAQRATFSITYMRLLTSLGGSTDWYFNAGINGDYVFYKNDPDKPHPHSDWNRHVFVNLHIGFSVMF